MFRQLGGSQFGEAHPPLEKDGRVPVLMLPRHHLRCQHETYIECVAQDREAELRDFGGAAALGARKAVEQASDGHGGLFYLTQKKLQSAQSATLGRDAHILRPTIVSDLWVSLECLKLADSGPHWAATGKYHKALHLARKEHLRPRYT